MKLSEAIMLGRHLVTPTGSPQPYHEEAGLGCALSMAHAAVKGKEGKLNWQKTLTLWPWLNAEPVISCPWCSAPQSTPGLTIAHAFDDHVMYKRITLEKLIDWVKTIEPADEPHVEKEVNLSQGIPADGVAV